MTSPSAHHRPSSRADRPLAPGEIGFGKLFHIVREAIIVVDADSRHIVFWNPAAEALFGYTSEEAVGQPVERFSPARLHANLTAAIANHAASWEQDEPIYERVALHRSGREIWIEYTATPVQWHGATYIITMVRDCTERKMLEAHRDAMLAAAQEYARHTSELADLKSDFTAMVAHELANPIATIRMLVDLVDRPELPDEDRRRAFNTIRAETGLLQRLAADIQATGTIERDDFSVQPVPVPVATLLTHAAASMRARLSAHDFRVEPPPDACVLADAARIGQVLRNLLDNASRHTPPGTRVVLRAERDNGKVRIRVTDNGPGIRPDELTQMLEKFARGKETGRRGVPGVGLGLYLSRLIVHAHGGRLRLTSDRGETTASFDLAEVPDD